MLDSLDHLTVSSAPLGSHRDRRSFQHIPFRVFRVGSPVEGTHPRCDREQSRGGESSMPEEREEWRAVPDWPGYEASNLGRVRSIPRQVACKDGSVKTFASMRVLPGSMGRHYLRVSLCDPTRPRRRTTVHTIIARTFLGPRPPGLEVRHLDGNKLNNHLANLRYGTHAENLGDAKAQGRMRRGEQCPASKVTVETVLEIRRLRDECGLQYKQIAKRVGTVTASEVRNIALRLRWAHV